MATARRRDGGREGEKGGDWRRRMRRELYAVFLVSYLYPVDEATDYNDEGEYSIPQTSLIECFFEDVGSALVADVDLILFANSISFW